MADINITTQNGLVQATIKQRQETYFLVTSDVLNSVKGKSLLCDLFLFLSSLGWGAFLSATITVNSITPPANEHDPLIKTLLSLRMLSSIFLSAAILFSLLTLIMYWQSYKGLEKIKTGGEINLNNNGK